MSDQTFDLLLSGITWEQKEAVRQLFQQRGWEWKGDDCGERVTDCEVFPSAACALVPPPSLSSDSVSEPAPSSSVTRPIERSNACAYDRGWGDSGESEDAPAGECPFCFCSPCVTFNRQS